MRTLRFALLGLLLLVVGYLLLKPVPVEPVAWHAPASLGYTGKFATNNLLADVELLPFDGLSGPEAMAVGPDGLLYISSAEGWIVKHNPATGANQRWVNTDGRPLGISFDAAGYLWVADAYRGLLAISPDGSLQLRSNSADGVAIRYADDLAIGSDGTVYFSDASTKFGAEANGGTFPASMLDIMEHGGHGRLLAYFPSTGKTEVLLSGLEFANGVAVSAKGDYLLLNETSLYRVSRYWLTGNKAGQLEVVADNLPGFPDNIVADRNHYWVGLVSPRNALLDNISDKPWLRKIVQRLPSALRPTAERYSHLVAIAGDGEVLASLQDPAGTFATITGGIRVGDWLYLSSLHEHQLARIALDKLPMQQLTRL